MEEQIILRVPPSLEPRLRDLIRGNATVSTSSQSVTATSTSTASANSSSNAVHLIFTDDRFCQLSLDGGATVFEGALVNLPNQIEIHKTFDHLSFFKAADISQMIIIEDPQVTSNNNAPPNAPESSNNPHAKKQQVWPPPFNYPSGLLPPTRDIRARRFERDTVVPKRVVAEVESMLHQIKENQPIHTIKLIEEEVEIEIDDYDQLIPPTPTPAVFPQFSPNLTNPLTNPLTGPLAQMTSPMPVPMEDVHLQPLPADLAGETPPIPTVLSPTESGSASAAFATEPTTAAQGQDMDVVATAESAAAEPAPESEEINHLRTELAELDRRIEEASTTVTKTINLILKRRATEKLTAIQAKRDAKQIQLDDLLASSNTS